MTIKTKTQQHQIIFGSSLVNKVDEFGLATIDNSVDYFPNSEPTSVIAILFYGSRLYYPGSDYLSLFCYIKNSDFVSEQYNPRFRGVRGEDNATPRIHSNGIMKSYDFFNTKEQDIAALKFLSKEEVELIFNEPSFCEEKKAFCFIESTNSIVSEMKEFYDLENAENSELSNLENSQITKFAPQAAIDIINRIGIKGEGQTLINDWAQIHERKKFGALCYARIEQLSVNREKNPFSGFNGLAPS